MASSIQLSGRARICEAAALVDSAARLLELDKFDERIMQSALWRIVDAAGMLAFQTGPSVGSDSLNPTGLGFYVGNVNTESQSGEGGAVMPTDPQHGAKPRTSPNLGSCEISTQAMRDVARAFELIEAIDKTESVNGALMLAVRLLAEATAENARAIRDLQLR